MQEEAFQKAYRSAKRQVVGHAISRLQKSSSEAVDTLREIMVDDEKPTSARVTAARTILDLAIRTVEIEDLEARIEKLENQSTRR